MYHVFLSSIAVIPLRRTRYETFLLMYTESSYSFLFMMVYKHLSEAMYETPGLKLSLALQESLFQHSDTKQEAPIFSL